MNGFTTTPMYSRRNSPVLSHTTVRGWRNERGESPAGPGNSAEQNQAGMSTRSRVASPLPHRSKTSTTRSLDQRPFSPEIYLQSFNFTLDSAFLCAARLSYLGNPRTSVIMDPAGLCVDRWSEAVSILRKETFLFLPFPATGGD